MRRLPVKDMPEALGHAARQAGYDGTHEMTELEALRVWSELHIGTPSWADDFLLLLEDFREDLRSQT